jgi:hypothetical protein
MRRWIALACLAGLLAGLAACNMPSAGTPTVGGIEFIRTSAAHTLDALSTNMAGQRGTPVAAATGTTASPVPKTPVPGVSQTPGKSQTPAAGTITSTPQACDQVTFLRDISIPDGTYLLPGTAFTKTWELKNSGSCAWNSMYTLVFANEGDLMGGAVSKPLITSGAVAPGEVVQVSVDLIAPAAPGDYKGNWRIRNPAGSDFAPGGKPFWVAVKVASKLMMIDNLCNAVWTTGAGDLACPGKPGDTKGSISRVNDPKFSTGYQDNEPAIQLEPQQTNDGLITGRFPPYQLNATDTQFRTIIACAYGSKACDTKVTITAQSGSDPEQILGEWNVVYANDWIMARVDLASKGMAGKAVVLRFYVRANGAANQDRVLFLSPIIAKP